MTSYFSTLLDISLHSSISAPFLTFSTHNENTEMQILLQKRKTEHNSKQFHFLFTIARGSTRNRPSGRASCSPHGRRTNSQRCSLPVALHVCHGKHTPTQTKTKFKVNQGNGTLSKALVCCTNRQGIFGVPQKGPLLLRASARSGFPHQLPDSQHHSKRSFENQLFIYKRQLRALAHPRQWELSSGHVCRGQSLPSTWTLTLLFLRSGW